VPPRPSSSAFFGHHPHVRSAIKIQTLLDYQVGDASDARVTNAVSQGEGVSKSGLLVGHAEQVLVRDTQQGVHNLLQFNDTGLSKVPSK
jgi:hypothetical protein